MDRRERLNKGKLTPDELIDLARTELEDMVTVLKSGEDVEQNHLILTLGENNTTECTVMNERSVPPHTIQITGKSMMELIGHGIRSSVQQCGAYAVLSLCDSYITHIPKELAENPDPKDFEAFREKHKTEALVGVIHIPEGRYMIHWPYVRTTEDEKTSVVITDRVESDDWIKETSIQDNLGDFFCVARLDFVHKLLEQCDQVIKSLDIDGIMPPKESVPELSGACGYAFMPLIFSFQELEKIGSVTSILLDLIKSPECTINAQDIMKLMSKKMEAAENGDGEIDPEDDPELNKLMEQSREMINKAFRIFIERQQKYLKRKLLPGAEFGDAPTFVSKISLGKDSMNAEELQHLIKETKLSLSRIDKFHYMHPHDFPVFFKTAHPALYDSTEEYMNHLGNGIQDLIDKYEGDKLGRKDLAPHLKTLMHKIIDKLESKLEETRNNEK